MTIHQLFRIASSALVFSPLCAQSTVPYPAPACGKAVGGACVLQNRELSFYLLPAGESRFQSRATGSLIRGGMLRLQLADGRCTDFQPVGQPETAAAAQDDAASRASLHIPGFCLKATYHCDKTGLTLYYSAELRDDSHYIIQDYRLQAEQPLCITQVCPLRLEGGNWSVVGTVPGSPLVDKKQRFFFGVELPFSEVKQEGNKAEMGFGCRLPMKAGEEQSFRCVSGIYPAGQLRRGFLAYLERERATPYHLFLLYNSWYEHGLQPDEAKMLRTVQAYGEELRRKRGIALDSFVLDDGWDDFQADLWQPSPRKFPQGFGKLAQAIRDNGSHFGIWISPLGGYNGIDERCTHARRMGLLPPDAEDMDLAEPAYYRWFRDRCRSLMREEGVNFFKWDRAGGGVSPHFMALLRIARELRREKGSLFLSTTVGTWPSPFWLQHMDCTWRSGSADIYWTGKGNYRERYMTYRDARCRDLIVQKGPLYPLNSLMHHGVVLGQAFQARRTSNADTAPLQRRDSDSMDMGEPAAVDFPVNSNLRHDVRMLMAAGANMQELYLSPDMMDAQAWDDVAEAIRWSRRFADVSADTHWLGGDPEKGEIYGYASWRGDKGAILALRNPDDKPRRISLNTGVLEPTHEGDILLRAAYTDQELKELLLKAKEDCELEIPPFGVLVFDARFDGNEGK